MFLRRKIKRFCPNCGYKIKIPYGDVRLEQGKNQMKIHLPSPIHCKRCGKDVDLPSIKIKSNGMFKFDW